MEEEVKSSESPKEFRPLHPGVREHFIRAVLFWRTARQTPEIQNQFRSLMAAAYSCRAMAELIFELADGEQMSISRDDLKKLFEDEVRYFGLVEKLRIHDFHRHGLQPPQPGVNIMRGSGPIKLTANGGSATFTQSCEGPKVICTGNSKVKQQRPLFEVNGAFYDEKTETHVPLPQIISTYLTDIPLTVEKCEKYYVNPKGMFETAISEVFDDNVAESSEVAGDAVDADSIDGDFTIPARTAMQQVVDGVDEPLDRDGSKSSAPDQTADVELVVKSDEKT